LAGIRGELGEAIRLLERCLTLTRDGNIAFFSPVEAWLLGRTYALSGRVGEGLALLQSGMTDMEAMGLSPYHAVALVDHGEALVLCDRLDDAGSCGERALRLAREGGERDVPRDGHALVARTGGSGDGGIVVITQPRGPAAYEASTLLATARP